MLCSAVDSYPLFKYKKTNVQKSLPRSAGSRLLQFYVLKVDEKYVEIHEIVRNQTD